ncbi:hypothetical protein ACH4Y0_02325 [Streptomyces sp. NPDC020707]|uniref:hypothetical protein n=1 Tax=Streptomyces sp. NPDC020707 TaxID=3365084 RepID=UPI0037AFBE70
MSDVKAPSPLKLVREFFGLNLSEVKEEWSTLPQRDKDDIVAGLRDGTLTY